MAARSIDEIGAASARATFRFAQQNRKRSEEGKLHIAMWGRHPTDPKGLMCGQRRSEVKQIGVRHAGRAV